MNIDSQSAVDDLPSLPQVLIHIVETVYQDEVGVQDLASVIQRDTALTLRLVAVANSGRYGRALASSSLRQCIVRLGLSSVRSLILAMVFQAFVDGFKGLGPAYLRAFWWRSATAAHFARRLAHLLGYPNADEAFLAGLLMNCGELVLASRSPAEARRDGTEAEQLARERRLFGTDHARVGADIALRSGLSPDLADALCFHHEPMENLRDAHQLVKIVALSSEATGQRVAAEPAWTLSDGLFGLNQSLLRELLAAVRDEVAQLAASLNLKEEEGEQQADVMRLQQMLSNIGQAEEATRDLLRARAPVAFEQALERGLGLLLQIRTSLLFVLDEGGGLLEGGYGDDGKPGFAVDLATSTSRVAQAFQQRVILKLAAAGGSVLDQQLCRRFQPDSCYAVPLVHERRCVGIVVAGVAEGRVLPGADQAFLFGLLRQQIAAALQQLRESLCDRGAVPELEDWQQRVREAIHEAGNPLSIIRNYLDVLRMRIGDQTLARGEIALIGEEIDRIGSILLRLRESGDESVPEEPLDAAQLVAEVADVFRKTLCTTRKLGLTTDLPSRPLPVRGGRGQLKQVLVNLVKNAVEALPEGGSIALAAAPVYAESGAPWAEISITDDGPGLTDPMMAQLFRPVSSTKGEGHSGLGLSITKKLIDQMGGRLTCKTGMTGTRFQVLLPSGDADR